MHRFCVFNRTAPVAHFVDANFLHQQRERLASQGPFGKGRVLLAASRTGAPVGGIRLPLVAPRLPSPRRWMELVNGPARRSLAARFFSGDLDLAAYSGNWDLTRRFVPSRACAYCFRTISGPPFVEDEWHLLLICPLYERFRRRIPFQAAGILVEGHPLQGEGCTTPRNLAALIRAVLSDPRRDSIIDYLYEATV